MQVQFDVTLDDILAFNRYCIQRSPMYQRAYRTLLISMPLLFVLLAAVMTLAANSPPWFMWLLVVAMLVAWPVVFPRRYWKSLDEFVINTMKTSPNRSMLGKHTLSLSERGLHSSSEVDESSMSWFGVERIEQDDQCIYLFIGATAAHVIPKRAFANAEQATEFHRTAKAFLEQAQAQSSASGR